MGAVPREHGKFGTESSVLFFKPDLLLISKL